jgi:hypothetical protein
MILSVLITSSFSFYDAYAATTNTLSFDYTSIVLEHSSGITCLQCSVTGNTISVTLSSPGNTNLIITLTRTTGTNDFFSPWIKFTATGTTGGTNFVTSGTHVISASTTSTLSPAITSALPATIFTNWLSLIANNSLYQRNAAIISPNDATVCNTNGGDSDGDGICQNWETKASFPAGTTCANSGHNGLCIRTSPSAPIYWLDCSAGGTTWKNMCPDPAKDDLYFEIDYMAGHRPSDASLDKIYNAFLNSPGGKTLHIQLDEQLPHVNIISSSGIPTAPGYDQLKYWWFGTQPERGNVSLPTNFETNSWMTGIRSQKGQVFHYVIFAHQQQGNTGSSGIAEMPGNDIMVSLGSFTGKVGTRDQQEGTLLHEMGHNLGLDHGGNDGVNCKPNYLSVMSYSRQFSDLVGTRPLDYSQSSLNTLNEGQLVESNGISQSLPINLQTVYGPPTLIVTTAGTSPINWNKVAPSTETVTMDINNMGTTGCPASISPPQTLYGFNDWGFTLKLFDHGGVGSSNGTSAPCPPGISCNLVVSPITCASTISTGCNSASSNNPNGTDTSDTRPITTNYIDEYSPTNSLVKKDTLDLKTIKKFEYIPNLNDPVNSSEDQELVTHPPFYTGPTGINDPGALIYVGDSWSNDGMHAPLIDKELDISDVAVMRIARINSLIHLLDGISPDDFIINKTAAADIYNRELELIKIDINNITYDNSMFDAYNKMQAFQSRFDDKGDNEILKPNSAGLNSTQILIADIIESQSKALPEFSTFSIIVLAVVFTSIVFFFRKQSGFSSKLGYANI